MSQLSAFLTLPPKGESPMKALIHKLRLLALRGLLTQAPLEGAIGIALRSVQRQLPELLKQSPREVVDIIGRPDT